MNGSTEGTALTVRDVLNGMEAMEKWTRQLREALATLDHDQSLPVQPLLAGPKKKGAIISGGQCPPSKKGNKKKKS